MKINQKVPLGNNSGIFKLKDAEFLANQRIAGRVAAQALQLLSDLVKDKTRLSLLELDKIAQDFIEKNDCIPTFLNYHGFPNCCCISLNKILVHGIPTDYHLQDGDIISFDLGVTYKGAIGDTALTLFYGEPKSQEHVRLVKTTEECLIKGIEAIKIGEPLGSIGYAINKHAKNNGFSVVDLYGGHGICITEDGKGIPHSGPFIFNKSNPNEGIRATSGLTIAIEPLLVIGSSNNTRVDKNGWDVICNNYCCHFEHSIFIHSDHVEIITDRKNL